jgi:hypothetical protein
MTESLFMSALYRSFLAELPEIKQLLLQESWHQSCSVF